MLAFAFPAVLAAALLCSLAGAAGAQPFNLGPQACAECHKPEYEVWQKTDHAEGYKEFHRKKEVRDILKVVGGRSPKQSEVCLACHYTVAKKDAAAKPDDVAGPSCESCHGPGSDYIKIHNDFGGPNVKKEQETPQHREQRIAAARKAGMIWPDLARYDVVDNCYSCHSMGRAKVDGAKLAEMIEAGHPVSEFEYIQYGQGEVRHRFYPPDTTVNKELSPKEKAEWYAIGQAAALVNATEALTKVNSGKFAEAQKARIDKAKSILGKIPEAQKVLQQPTDENGRAFAQAIRGKDLTTAVGPVPTNYK
jgi:hypothetical protein